MRSCCVAAPIDPAAFIRPNCGSFVYKNRMPHCQRCGETKAPSCFARDRKWLTKHCKTCRNIAKHTRTQLHKQFPLKTHECEICSKPGKLVLDHDHHTGMFRGFLCQSCNVGLGCFDDNLEGLSKALEYLNKNEC